MATLASTNLTFADWAKRVDPDGNTAQVVEQLSQVNAMIDDAIVKEGNLQDGHKTTVRTSLPQGTFRMLNERVADEKSTSKQITDRCGMLETYADVDKALADLNGNTAEFLFSEQIPFMEGLSQTMAQTLLYGNTSTDPAKFNGFAPRYNSLTGDNADYVIDCGGTGSDNTSIWLIGWGDQTCFMHFPKGSKAGLQHTHKGQQTSETSEGKKEVYRDHYRWDAGLVVKDNRFVVRLANIDVSDLTGSGTLNLLKKMGNAIDLIHDLQSCKPVFYVHRTVRSKMREQINEKSNVNLTIDSAGGKQTVMFGEVPVKIMDQILKTESAVS
jgi:hypothetical protein